MERVKRKTGRPLSFDRSAALRAAMLAFWRHGYETTSIVDLTTAMGITAPSLYTAFGDKRKLFLETVELYAGDPAERERTISGAASAYQAASNLLEAVAVAYTGEDTPAGCLLASATTTGSFEAIDVQRVVADIRRGLSAQLAARITQDISEGLLPATCDAQALADLVVAVTQGMSVLARDGGSREQLLAVACSAMTAWPDRGQGKPFRQHRTIPEAELQGLRTNPDLAFPPMGWHIGSMATASHTSPPKASKSGSEKLRSSLTGRYVLVPATKAGKISLANARNAANAVHSTKK